MINTIKILRWQTDKWAITEVNDGSYMKADDEDEHGTTDLLHY